MKRKVKRAIIFIVVGGLILFINITGLLKDNEDVYVLVIEETKATLNEYTNYGRFFNVSGEIALTEEDLSLVLINKNGEENEYPLYYTIEDNKTIFKSNEFINTGINLDNLLVGNYFIVLKTISNDEIKYYSFEENIDLEFLDYYSTTKKGKNNHITTSFTKNYFKFTVIEEKLPEDIFDIVIDPGHGGRDSGAISGEEYEKKYVLSISLELKEALEELGYKVFLTRTDDSSPGEKYGDPYSKGGRVDTSMPTKAKILFSVHLNSSEEHYNDSGVEIYTSPKMDLEFASSLAKNVVDTADTNYSMNQRYQVKAGIYIRSFLARELAEKEIEATELGFEMYPITDNTPYYYMLRETGGIITGAYVDGRDPEYSKNNYYDKNFGIESYILELGYIISDEDLSNIISNQTKYVEGVTKTIKSYFE